MEDKMPNPSLKATALIIALLVLAILFVNFLSPSNSFFVPVNIIGVLTVIAYLWLFVFSTLDIKFVRKHTHGWTASGKATVWSTEVEYVDFKLDSFMHVKTFLSVRPKKSRFMGRWTVYSLEEKGFELWHDHFIFGGQWYYFKY